MYGKATQKFCEIATYFNHMPCILGLCAQDFNATVSMISQFAFVKKHPKFDKFKKYLILKLMKI